METLSSFNEAQASTARPASTLARLNINSLEMSTVRKRHRETIDDESELIEVRYQQALAVLNLENLFAEGLLNCG